MKRDKESSISAMGNYEDMAKSRACSLSISTKANASSTTWVLSRGAHRPSVCLVASPRSHFRAARLNKIDEAEHRSISSPFIFPLYN